MRKNIPKNIATKPPRMLSLANCTATTRRGMLERKRNDRFKDQQKRKEALASKINKKKKVDDWFKAQEAWKHLIRRLAPQMKGSIHSNLGRR